VKSTRAVLIYSKHRGTLTGLNEDASAPVKSTMLILLARCVLVGVALAFAGLLGYFYIQPAYARWRDYKRLIARCKEDR